MLYFEKMKALIGGWRQVWNEGDFPFYYVQIAPLDALYENDRLPRLWEAQLAALTIPNTGMVVTTDIGDLKDIHPKNKQDVGKRLALWALAKTYGRDGLVCSGPLYKSMAVEGDRIRVRFDSVGSGLASRDGKPLNWFEIAGDDRKFVKAEATIDGDSVVVRSATVSRPVAVRFGWNRAAEPNLMNKEGLPASPFRTDKW
jgi:sialate O-acetylesterase